METGVTRRIDSVYVHIPFCERFCSYCHFVRVPLGHYDLDSYIDALICEINDRLQPASQPLYSLYFGGGTPSLLGESQLTRLVKALSSRRQLSFRTEFTLEVNPSHINPENLLLWREAGVNRLSIGVQSFCDEELRLLGRDHSSVEAEAAVWAAAQAGFRRLSIDILASLKGQTWACLQNSLKKATALPIDHLSLYLLEKPGLSEPDDEKAADLYERSCGLLNESGLKRYEISSFARPGGQSRHNRLYWRNGSYYGFGAAASGFDGRCECRNTASIDAYMKRTTASCSAIDREEYPDPLTRRLVTGLRLRSGLPESAFRRSTPAMLRLLQDGLLERRLGRVRIHAGHILHTNSILTALI